LKSNETESPDEDIGSSSDGAMCSRQEKGTIYIVLIACIDGMYLFKTFSKKILFTCSLVLDIVVNSVHHGDGSSSSSNDDDGAMYHTKREKKKKQGNFVLHVIDYAWARMLGLI
jgi:hypothetical protein